MESANPFSLWVHATCTIRRRAVSCIVGETSLHGTIAAGGVWGKRVGLPYILTRRLSKGLVGVCKDVSKHSRRVRHALAPAIDRVSWTVGSGVVQMAALCMRRLLTVKRIHHSTGSLKASRGWCHERGGVDGGHPNSGLVDLEQVGNQRVEIDVGISKIVKRELLPVPRCNC